MKHVFRSLSGQLSGRGFPAIGLFGALCLAGPAAWSVPAGAEQLKAHYGVSLIGLPVGAASITANVDETVYKLELNTKLTGLASILSSFKAAGTAAGTMGPGHPAPASYATTSANSTMTRTVRMAMDAGTVRGVDISPPFDRSIPRVPVTEADRRDILDPLSAFVMEVPTGQPLVGESICHRVLPIFDGATRFDINLTYVGTRHVKAKGYDGDVTVCSARYKPISGHRTDTPAAQYMADNTNMEVWLAPIGNRRVVFPFRISVLTMVGTTVIQADDFSLDGNARTVGTR